MSITPPRSDSRFLQGTAKNPAPAWTVSREWLDHFRRISQSAGLSAEQIAEISQLLQDSGLTEIGDLQGTGLIVKKASGLATRQILGTTRVGVTNGGGTASNPVIDLLASGVTADVYGSASQIPILTIDAYGRVTLATSIAVPDSAVPFFIPDGDTYTVAANKQALFTLPIELDGDAQLVVDGALVEVD